MAEPAIKIYENETTEEIPFPSDSNTHDGISSPLIQNVPLYNVAINGEKSTIGGVPIADIGGSLLSIGGWSSNIVFTAQDFNTIGWAAGSLILKDETFSIVSGNTAEMTAVTYIYFDYDVSETVLQVTTTAADSVGANKILICVAAPNADTASEATFQVFGGLGGGLFTADNIAANSITINELAANTLIANNIKAGTFFGQKFFLGTTYGIYTNRKKIVIDHTKISADLVDFPVLVKLTSSNFNFAEANADGFDIRFSDYDGYTLLKYERVYHDNANSLAEYWVKIPAVSSSVDTEFYIYFTTADTADGADPENVWNSDFEMVQHLKDATTSTVLDSTSNNNDGAKKGANEPIEAAGKINKAQNFDGANDYINFGAGSGLDVSTAFTLSFWIKPTFSTNAQIILVKGDWGTGWDLVMSNSGDLDFRCDGLSTTDNYSAFSLTQGVWNHVMITFDSVLGQLCFYKNGVADTPLARTGAINVVASNLLAGDPTVYGAGMDFLKGYLEEVKFSSVARSASWAGAYYNSENNTLLTLGTKEVIEEAQDCFIAAGKNDFTNTKSGFILGIDQSDSYKPKFMIGNDVNYLNILGDTIVNTLKTGAYTALNANSIIAKALNYSKTTSQTYVKMKELRIGRAGDYKIEALLYASVTDPNSCYHKLKKVPWNPLTFAYGAEVDLEGVGGAELHQYARDEDTYYWTVSGLNSRDLIRIYSKCAQLTAQPEGAFVEEFKALVDFHDEVFETLVTYDPNGYV